MFAPVPHNMELATKRELSTRGQRPFGCCDKARGVGTCRMQDLPREKRI